MRTIYLDVRYGLRVLLGSPGFTAVAMLTLALGLAVNATVFGWIDTLLLRPFPGVSPAQELFVLETSTSSVPSVGMSFIEYRDYREHLKLVSSIALARRTDMNVGPEGRTQRAWGELVSGNYFDFLGVKPVLGRGFLAHESGDRPGAAPVVVISDRIWQKRFNRNPNVLGKTLRTNRHELTIVGVTPPEFHGTFAGVVCDLWIPITMANEMGTGTGTLGNRGTRDITTTLVQLKPGVTIEQARSEVAMIAGLLSTHHPDTNRGLTATLVPLREAHNGAQILLSKPLQVLLGIGVLLLLIVCANVANLLLARTVSRQKEFGIRVALGASSWRITRQLFTETLLLAAGAAFLGTILSMWMAQSLAYLLPPTDVPVLLHAGINFRILCFTALAMAVAILICGAAPGLLTARLNTNEVLKEGGRSGLSGTRSHRLRGLLVTSEIALATVALIGAGLFFRSFQNASTLDPRFDMSNTLIARFYLSNSGYSGAEQRQFCKDLRRRMAAVPGVTAMSYADAVPLDFGLSPAHALEVEGYVAPANYDMRIHRSYIAPGHLDLLQIPLVEGRDFTEKDAADAPQVIIVNETFRNRFFGSGTAVGRRVKVEQTWTTVVGVAKDSKYHSPIESSTPYFYAPFLQRFSPGLNFTVFIKTPGDPRSIVQTFRREALTLNQDADFSHALLSESRTAALYPQKVAASFLTVLGAACVLLAAIGLYSVMSYAVSQRTQELGVRIALGARPLDVLWLALWQGLKLTIPGLLLGMALASATSKMLSGMLVNVSTQDPATFTAAVTSLGVIGILASYIPARRATKVDPMTSLRCA